MSFEELSEFNARLGARYEADRERMTIMEAIEPLRAWTDEVELFIREEPEKASEIFPRLAESANRYDRELVAMTVDELCAVNVKLGVELWERMLLDDDGDIRGMAWSTIEIAFGEQRYSAEDTAYMVGEFVESLQYWHDQARRRPRSHP
jgi:hypothetical protein